MRPELRLDHLDTSNKEVIANLYGEEFKEKSMNDLLDPAVVIEANHVLAEFLYGSDIAKLVREKKTDRLDKIHRDNLEDLSLSEKIIDEIDLENIGLVLVRPEIIETATRCANLIADNGLAVIYERPVEINFTQYWNLYHHGLADPESYNDFPTRTLNYIEKPCHLMIVGRDKSADQRLPLSDLLTRDLKGRQGTYKHSTLRGDIAYTALRQFIAGPSMFVPNMNMALDPIGAYRSLVRNQIPSDKAHETVDTPLLFYAGQGVHIPNSEEIRKDIRTLCSDEDLEAIVRALAL